MTPAAARRRAIQYIRALGLPDRLDGLRVQLTHYPDADTLAFLRPGEDLATQRAISAAFASEISARGGLPEHITLHLSDYFTWLARFTLRDTPATRAQFIAWTTAPPDQKPTPPPCQSPAVGF